MFKRSNGLECNRGDRMELLPYRKRRTRNEYSTWAETLALVDNHWGLDVPEVEILDNKKRYNTRSSTRPYQKAWGEAIDLAIKGTSEMDKYIDLLHLIHEDFNEGQGIIKSFPIRKLQLQAHLVRDMRLIDKSRRSSHHKDISENVHQVVDPVKTTVERGTNTTSPLRSTCSIGSSEETALQVLNCDLLLEDDPFSCDFENSVARGGDLFEGTDTLCDDHELENLIKKLFPHFEVD